MLRFAAILSLALAVGACTTGAVQVYEGPGKSAPLSSFSKGQIQLRHLDSVNALRVERGLRPLTLSAELNAAAATHARDMAQQRRAWNFGSDRSSPQSRAIRAGFVGVVRGENVAESFLGEFYVLEAWLEDRFSRAAIFDPQISHLGIGWYQEENGKVWWVQDLAVKTVPAVTAELQ